MPQIQRLLVQERPVSAFAVMQSAERYLPGDPDLRRAIEDGTRISTIESTPVGALVEVKDYLARDEPWSPLGTTPLTRIRVPKGFLRWRVTKAGAGEFVVARESEERDRFELDRAASAPPGMVPVSGGPWTVGWFDRYLGRVN